ncbi:MAG TPA: transglutaminaseTgpA domain-containing protein [Thermoanaerobaculia bacterium]|nr:transglutaminaseTgpA domain-containing protein [Thermoanaerobaculia bacterium]
MTRRGREVEVLLLAMLAAVPLYFNYAIGIVPLVMFHAFMAAITVRVALGRGPDVVPPVLMRVLAFAYIGFYVVDAAVISRSAIAASTHLVLFIAAYQPIESLQRNNLSQRLLTTGLIFIASLATSTHIVIVAFVLLFGFLMFRQMIYVSHMETIRVTGRPYALAPASRAAAFYIAGATLIGAVLFPILPRLRNPIVPGMIGALGNTTTGLSDAIDFNQSRTSSPDPAVVARVWISPDAIPFFTPLRLRGAVYDSYSGNRWLQTSDRRRSIRHQRGVYRIARPLGFARVARVQQVLTRTEGRLFLPAGTYAVTGLPQVLRGPTRDSYLTISRTDSVTYEASMSRAVEPLEPESVRVPAYPAGPEVVALARQIAGSATGLEARAELVETYLLRNYQYVQRPEDIGRTAMTTEEFLLTVRRGHCEYFAAGMVTLLSTLNVPARIVGGFYGGRMNPLTGYFVIRREDAHAWVEAWNGSRWVTFDPTPPALRPGGSQGGMVGSYLSALGESATYFWDRYVLTFGLGDQVALAMEVITQLRRATRASRASFRRAVDVATSPGMVALYAGLLALVLLLWIVPLRRRPAFELLVRHLRACGIEVGPAMTVEEALSELRSERPEEAERLAPLIALYEQERFSGRTDPGRGRLLRKRLAELRA